MNREDCKALLDKLSKDKHMSFVIFFRSPLTDEVEERHVFADVEWEGKVWLNLVTEYYFNAKIPFATYVNGQYYAGEGSLF